MADVRPGMERSEEETSRRRRMERREVSARAFYIGLRCVDARWRACRRAREARGSDALRPVSHIRP